MLVPAFRVMREFDHPERVGVIGKHVRDGELPPQRQMAEPGREPGAVHHQPQAEHGCRGEDDDERCARGIELDRDELHDAAEAGDRHRERLERRQPGRDARDAGDQPERHDADERRRLGADAGEEPLAGRVGHRADDINFSSRGRLLSSD